VTHRLCRLDELAEPDARGFSIDQNGRRLDLFVVRSSGRVYGYVDSCPHIGTPLEFLPDRFLTRDQTQILCSTHGARFEIGTGLCVAGPCKGRSLERVPVMVNEGWVVLKRNAD
jgi:nitrite reductase/ring-hydroxylating ferredoxin subunit